MFNMKKILLTSLSVVVAGTVWFGVSNQKPSEANADEEVNEPLVLTVADENLEENGTISDAIHNASIFLDGAIATASNFSEVLNIEVVEEYSNDAVEVAENRSAHPKVLDKLKQSKELVQQAVADQDLSKLQKANQLLLGLDLEFNSDIFTDKMIEDIESKLK